MRPESDRGAILAIRGAALSYGPRRVLDGIDLALAPGQVLALIGPNGAGKTSLLRLAAGRLAPERGSVRVSGGDPLRAWAARRTIGFVPQEIALYARLTVAENLDVFARLSGCARRARRASVADLLDRTDLAEVAGRPVMTLSGGYQRRVNLAASLVGGPALILLDEPTQGVDLDARAAIHAVLSALRARGAALVLSTHDFAEAERLADRVAVLSGGRILREGRLDDLMRPFALAPPEREAILDDRPGPDACAALARAGFAAQKTEARVWRAGPGPADGLDAAALLASLREAGVPVAEIRVRRPGLEALYRDCLADRLARAPRSAARAPTDAATDALA